MRSARRGPVAWESSSAQISWRLPVLASITTIGARLAKAADMFTCGTARLVRRSRPGTTVTIVWPGLKPSERL